MSGKARRASAGGDQEWRGGAEAMNERTGREVEERRRIGSGEEESSGGFASRRRRRRRTGRGVRGARRCRRPHGSVATVEVRTTRGPLLQFKNWHLPRRWMPRQRHRSRPSTLISPATRSGAPGTALRRHGPERKSYETGSFFPMKKSYDSLPILAAPLPPPPRAEMPILRPILRLLRRPGVDTSHDRMRRLSSTSRSLLSFMASAPPCRSPPALA